MKIPIAFECHGDTIRGAFHPAEEALSAPIVLLLRGFPPYEDSPFADRLTKRDIHVVTIDFRGALQSDGVFTLSNVQEDIQAAIAFLQQDGVPAPYGFDADQLILGGISFGGGMALAYAVWHPEIKRIFSLAGNDFGDFARQYKRDPDFASMTDAMFEELWTSSDTVRLGNRTVKELLDDPRPYDLRLNAPALADRDILLIGGWDDHEVTIEDRILPFYRALKEAGAQTVQIAAVQDDHSFEKCGQEVVELIVRWLKLSEPS